MKENKLTDKITDLAAAIADVIQQTPHRDVPSSPGNPNAEMIYLDMAIRLILRLSESGLKIESSVGPKTKIRDGISLR
jgi:hypothetical protein